MDFALARRNMVDCQIHTMDVTERRILAAFKTVPREMFVPAAQRDRAYIDDDVKVSDGDPPRYLIEPVVLAQLVQEARIAPDAVVLDVGCCTGYSSAIIAELASSVVGLEADEDLAAKANEALAESGHSNAVVVTGPLPAGYAKEGPYDAIVVGGAIDEVPQALFDQLRDGGRLVCVVGEGLSGRGMTYVKVAGLVSGRPAFNAAVKPLPGFAQEPEFVL